MTYQVWYQEPIEVVGFWRRDRPYGDVASATQRATMLFERGEASCVRILDYNRTLVYQRGLEDK